MKGREFRSRLKSAGISQRKFALYFGFDVGTVNRWAKDRASIPQYAARIVEILASEPKLVTKHAMHDARPAA